jgi:segregation and condensation protein B
MSDTDHELDESNDDWESDDSAADVADVDSESSDEESSEEVDTADDQWPAGDLESAYRRALEANDAVEWEFEQLPESAEGDDPAGDEGDLESTDSNGTDDATASEEEEDPVEAALPQRITPRQVVEAAIFVGGEPLTTKKLCYMFRGDYELDFIEDTIDDLNRQYVDEGRPYEIRLGEGGYRMVLRTEFERVRNRVFGIGPREVKLSQEILEVLAVVAYRQPITQNEIEKLGKANPGGMLRQLLRRELIAIERDPENRKQVKYVTAQRFLSLFGLGNLNELPEADELAFK